MSKNTVLIAVAVLVAIAVSVGGCRSAQVARTVPAGAPGTPGPGAEGRVAAQATAEPAQPEGEQAVSPSEGIAWVHSFTEGMEKAKAEGKPVMIDAYADWCGPCKMLDSDTWPDPKVVELSEKFVCVKVNVDEDPATAQRFKVSSIPLVFFILPDGTEVMPDPGFRDAGQMASEMQAALERAG